MVLSHILSYLTLRALVYLQIVWLLESISVPEKELILNLCVCVCVCVCVCACVHVRVRVCDTPSPILSFYKASNVTQFSEMSLP